MYAYLLCLVLMSQSTEETAQPAPDEDEVTITVGEAERTYYIYVPSGERPEEGWPVVLAFHGGGSNALAMREFCGLNETAEAEGFVVVYPQGSGRARGVNSWNAGNCCGYAQRQEIDEVAFVEALLDDLPRRLPIDPRRIYATGMSNGAMMSYLVADRLSERVAAIAPVAGPMGYETCAPTRPVPVMHFHGTDDEFAAYNGGPGARSLSRANFYSVEHTIAQWVAANGCESDPEVTQLEPTVDDGTQVTRSVYNGGEEGAEVVLFTIHGGGHTWPGRESRFRFLGPTTENLDANAEMWQFFQRHALPAAGE